MLVKRQAEAAKAPSAETIVPATEKAPDAQETASITAPPEVAAATQPDKGEVAKETPAKAEPEATDPDEVLSKQLSPELQEVINKRIGKEVGKRKALEEKLAALEARLNAPPQPQEPIVPILPMEPTSDNPLANIVDPNALLKEQQTAKEAKRWAQEMLDRDDIDQGVNVGGKTYTKQELKSVVRNADRMIEDYVPARAQYLQTRFQVETQVRETFGAEPWMQDKGSEGYQLYQQLLKDPDIVRRPNGSWTAAVQVQGLLEVQKRKRASGQPVTPLPVTPTKQKAPASQVAGGQAGPIPNREPGESRAVKALEAEMEKLKGKKGITGRDAEAYLRKVELSRSTR